MDVIKRYDGVIVGRPAGVCVQVAPGPKGCRVLIDGQDVTNVSSSIQLYAGPRSVPMASIELVVGRLHVEGVQVEVDANTEELLVSLGWTRPGDRTEAGRG